MKTLKALYEKCPLHLMMASEDPKTGNFVSSDWEELIHKGILEQKEMQNFLKDKRN